MGSFVTLLCVSAQQSYNALSLRGICPQSVGPFFGPFVRQIPFSWNP